MNRPEFYIDKVSAFPGEEVVVYANYDDRVCRLIVTRVSTARTHIATIDGHKINQQKTNARPDRDGCGWQPSFSFRIGAEWPTGYYDLKLEGPDGAHSRNFVCVKRSENSPPASAVMILNTNTYHAYNYWGGANAYAHVTKLQIGEITADESRECALGVLSADRPYAQGLLAPPNGMPRLVNAEPRNFGTPGQVDNIDWFIQNQPSPYDGSAGFLGKWEHQFSMWCEKNQYDIDYLTDHDFESGEDPIRKYGTVFLVGHSEYWSGKQRDAFDDYVNGGGNLAVFSGNTGYWKVRWEDNARSLICHKCNGVENDPLFRDPKTRQDATHLTSHPAFGKPEAEVTGLSFLYGGYHRLGMCVARGSSAYTVYNDKHWSLEGTDLFYGDQIGSSLPFLGYENDGCPISFGSDGLPKSAEGIGIPENLEIIALAPATLFEPPDNPFPSLIPEENVDVLAEVAYGESTSETRARLARGHAVMAFFSKGEGQVFNGGTTEWAHGLAAGDPYVEKITHNVLSRFGVERHSD